MNSLTERNVKGFIFRELIRNLGYELILDQIRGKASSSDIFAYYGFFTRDTLKQLNLFDVIIRHFETTQPPRMRIKRKRKVS